ncbi:MAG TPA: TIGR03086 family metal-binding protein [Micromonospora sp.]|nr:TIGR03086 family metal-binding protein [Micromonospora sp.]
MDLLEAYRRSLTEFTDRVAQVGSDQWTAPTPCPDWNVRALVNHVVSEDRWTVPILAGATIAEVGNRFDRDLLGSSPATITADATAEAERAASEPGALDRTVHLSAGDTPASEYLRQLLADHLVHGWDLAVAVGAEPRLDSEAVHECAIWFTQAERMYRDAGLIGPRFDVPGEASEQDRLLAAFGRDPAWHASS